MTIRSIRCDEDRWNADQILSLLMPVVEDAYEDAGLLIMKDLAMSTHIYLLEEDVTHELQGFLMVGFGQPATLALTERRSAYVGLSAVRIGARGSGNCLPLFRAFIRDGRQFEVQDSTRYLVWGTTANKTVWRLFGALFRDVAPSVGVAASKQEMQWASEIRQVLRGNRGAEPNIPFYWPAHKPDIRYSESEWKRILKENETFSFHHWVIDDRRGDRLLMIGHLPGLPPSCSQLPGTTQADRGFE
jgi:hypothetical protein